MASFEDTIKQKIEKLYHTNPHIHMDVYSSRPKVLLKGEPATIVGIYPHVFQIEESSSGTKKCHTLQYIDIITKNIVIYELQ